MRQSSPGKKIRRIDLVRIFIFLILILLLISLYFIIKDFEKLERQHRVTQLKRQMIFGIENYIHQRISGILFLGNLLQAQKDGLNKNMFNQYSEMLCSRTTGYRSITLLNHTLEGIFTYPPGNNLYHAMGMDAELDKLVKLLNEGTNNEFVVSEPLLIQPGRVGFLVLSPLECDNDRFDYLLAIFDIADLFEEFIAPVLSDRDIYWIEDSGGKWISPHHIGWLEAPGAEVEKLIIKVGDNRWVLKMTMSGLLRSRIIAIYWGIMGLLAIILAFAVILNFVQFSREEKLLRKANQEATRTAEIHQRITDSVNRPYELKQTLAYTLEQIASFIGGRCDALYFIVKNHQGSGITCPAFWTKHKDNKAIESNQNEDLQIAEPFEGFWEWTRSIAPRRLTSEEIADSSLFSLPSLPSGRDMILFPVSARENGWGALAIVLSASRQDLPQGMMENISSFCVTVAFALENAYMLNAQKELTENLRDLNVISHSLLESHGKETIFQNISQAVVWSYPIQLACLWELDEGDGQLNLRAADAKNQDIPPAVLQGISEDIRLHVLERHLEEESVFNLNLVDELKQGGYEKGDWMDSLHLRYYSQLALGTFEARLGCMVLVTISPLDYELIEILKLVAGQAALVIKDLERLKELHKAIFEAEKSKQLASEILANMHHELKNPISTIKGYAEALSNDFDKLTDQQRNFFLEVIISRVTQLDQLISDILELSSLQHGEAVLTPERHPIAESLEAVMQLISPMAASKRVNIEIQVEPNAQNIYADRQALKKILLHLMDNAVKFSLDEGNVWVHCKLSRNQDAKQNLYVIEVKDEGIGFREQDRAYLFEPFWQAERSYARRHGGAGIGLSLVKEYAQKHGGSIEITGTCGEGSTCRLELPQPEDVFTEAPDRYVLAVGLNHENSDRLQKIVQQKGIKFIHLKHEQPPPAWSMNHLPEAILLELPISNAAIDPSIFNPWRRFAVPIIALYNGETNNISLPEDIHALSWEGDLFRMFNILETSKQPTMVSSLTGNGDPAEARRMLSGKVALLAYPSAISAEQLVAMFNQAGMVSLTADNGSEAILKLAYAQLDFVCLSLLLPSVDAIAIMNELAQKRQGYQVPIFLSIEKPSGQLVFFEGVDGAIINQVDVESLRQSFKDYLDSGWQLTALTDDKKTAGWARALAHKLTVYGSDVELDDVLSIEAPNLVLLDCKAEKKRALDVLSRLNTKRENMDIRCLVIIEQDFTEQQREQFNKQLTEYYFKPMINSEDIVKKIAQILKIK